MRPTVKLERRVMGQDRIPSQLGSDEVRVDRIGLGGGSWRDDGIQPAPRPNNAACLRVVGQQRFLRSCSDLTPRGEMRGQLLTGKDGMLAEELRMFHDGYV